MNRIIPYRKDLKARAQLLRKNMTVAEKLIWNRLRKKQLHVEFHRQVPMLDYIIDFYCHEIGLAIEIDGPIHNTQVLYDGKRQERLEKYGVHFLRFTNEQVFQEAEEVLISIKNQIQQSL